MNIDPTTAAVLALHFERDIVEPDVGGSHRTAVAHP